MIINVCHLETCITVSRGMSHVVTPCCMRHPVSSSGVHAIASRSLSCALRYELLGFRAPALALAVIRGELGAAPGTALADFIERLLQLMGIAERELAACEDRVEVLLARPAAAAAGCGPARPDPPWPPWPPSGRPGPRPGGARP